MASSSASQSSVLPAFVEELCLVHDKACDRIRTLATSVESELSEALDREDRLELAAAVADAAEQLKSLFDAKLDSGYFEGCEGTSERCQDRAAHLKSDYRRRLNGLREIEHEIASGKPRKAERQLNHWRSHFTDVLDRETEILNELWKQDTDVS